MSHDSGEDAVNVTIAGYLSKHAATKDYDSVLGCGVHLLGAVVVSKSLTGELDIEQTDHLVAEGAAGLGAVGLVVGLFAPPLLAATAVGAAMGAGLGGLLHGSTERKLEKLAGETIPIGGAGLIVAYPSASAQQVAKAITRAVSLAVGEAEGHHLKALKSAVADAQKKLEDAKK